MSLAFQDPQVILTVGAKAFLTQMVAALQHLALATVDLYQNDVTPTAEMVIGDFDICSVAGPPAWAEYLQKATTAWGDQATDPTGRVYIAATPLLTWTGPALGSGPAVYGYVVKSAQAGTPLLYAVRFPAPVDMVDDSKVLNLIATFTLPNVQNP